MKKFSLILGITAMLATSFAQAGTIQVATVEVTPFPAPGDKYEFTLNVLPGNEGTFDTVELIVDGPMNQTPAGGDGALIQSSETDSGFSAFLEAPSAFGGQGLTLFGIDATTDTENGISGTAASIGDNSASTQGNYVLAQVVSPGAGSYRYSFFDDGNLLGEGQGVWGIPEPATIMLAGLGLIGFVGTRRRS